MGELGGEREERDEREEREARDCGVSCERLVLPWFRGSGLNTEPSLDMVSSGRR